MLAAAKDVERDETDTGPRRGSAVPERLCIATRQSLPTAQMIRFVVAPDGAIVADLKQNLPGRGVWVTATREALAQAVARKAFGRGFKREVKVPPDLVDATERLLERAALDALSIAGKAGQVVSGHARVETALARNPVAALFHAADGSRDGAAKIIGTLRQRPDAARIVVIRAFSSAQLDLALGRLNVVHAALLAGPAGDTFLARFCRLERFRTGKSDTGGDLAHPAR